jgi:hypothetical protein
MKINPIDIDHFEEEREDRWQRRDRKVKNRSRLKEPTDSRNREKNKEKPLTRTEKQSIIEQ